jgi:cytidylate kinase
MQLICISRGSFAAGRELAEKLSRKLDVPCVGREELVDQATESGIPVGKLEMAMIKPHLFTERLARQKDHFRAYMTKAICERLLKHERLVYHGRTGHMLFRGIDNIFRVRVVAEMDYRIRAVMQRLHLDRDKARQYIEEVEEDRKRWVKEFYGVNWEEAVHYDVIINTSQMNLDNASSALCSMAQLPEFQLSPASRRSLEDLLLAARVRVALAQDPRTSEINVKVQAHRGSVTVTYMPQQARLAGRIPEVVESLEGIGGLTCTPANTNILWIQERYDPGEESFLQLVQIASKWGAAIELLRFTPEDTTEEGTAAVTEGPGLQTPSPSRAPVHFSKYNGGIEDDSDEPDGSLPDGGVRTTLKELTRVGVAGGARRIHGGQEKILAALDRTTPYSLVVVDSLFLSKGHAARTRATRELRNMLEQRLKVPVVGKEDLKSHFLFGRTQMLKLLGCLAAVSSIYAVVFKFQWQILGFLSPTETSGKICAAIAIALFVPLVAYLYGTATGLALKLLKME